MKKLILTLLIIFSIYGNLISEVIYTDPMPNSKFVSIENNLIIGLDRPVISEDLNFLTIKVTGTKSGIHNGELQLSNDKKRIIWKHSKSFSENESIRVEVSSTSTNIVFNSKNIFSYSFQTERKKTEWNSENTLRSELGKYYGVPFNLTSTDPPEAEIIFSDNPSEGKIFLSNFSGGFTSYLLIANNDGSYFFSRNLQYPGYDFKKQPNGTLTYYEGKKNKFFQLNDKYEMIDSFECGNGYETDLHEMRLLPNGHILLMAYDGQEIDMSKIINGGNPDALVVGLIIQELDENKDVVFQWRSWDHFNITDATHEDLLAGYIDYVHGNALELDTDGNILLSSRHLDEITKIDRNTGDIIWRLGGKNNEFTFINDPLGFSHQHAIRKISNGNITLFDNGNFHSPPFSRAVEYKINETNKTATLVWEYRNIPSIYGFAMGYVERLENGNTLIGWGFSESTVSEVTPDGKVALEMKLSNNAVSYRVYKFDWNNSVSVGSENGIIPENYELSQNYPNPFNPSTSIGFSLPVAGNVSLKIYDIMGREVASLLNGYKQAGTYSLHFDASKLTSGVYVYKIESGNYTSSKKMVLLK